MATGLYDRMIAFNFHQPDSERAELMQKVWSVTPWMVDAWTGGYGEHGRMREMLDWCHEQFGPQSSPIHDRIGRWQQGYATVHGWTWFGFDTETDLQAFVARWPVPDGVEVPA